MDMIPLSSQISFAGDASLAAVLEALRPVERLPLVLDYDGRKIQPGYHVTEVKAGSFMTIDCGGDPDAWRETVLQVEDLPASPQTPHHMPVGKFLAILDKVAQRLLLDQAARLTFEIGPPGQPMQVFDVDELRISSDVAQLHLCARPAICKPRHRAQSRTTPRGGATPCC
ncbi:MAG TPA: DUF6428 family protein [Acidisoma sp.]|uniref:DUF6428 family protein n=1 Tax=Acidisoma sp. TaxID=1872115 RepID=UPI002CA4CFF2|nr:DUF6428 family protein [Acidisoma sp.]HTI00826.1 DUF6428 family protein [Acidisoma sp.]